MEPRGRWIRSSTALGLALMAVSMLGCPGEGGSQDPQVRRGRAVYLSNCIACHATNPTQSGGIGPDVADSSLELLQARLLRNEYPPGYTPKRDTGVMPIFPHLEGDLPALHAFLAAAARSE